MKGIKQAFDRITSKVVNSQRGCVQCDNEGCKCKHRNAPVNENPIPPTPGCCDLKQTPFFGSFVEPITSTEYISDPFIIQTTDGVGQCQVTLEFNAQCPDNECDTYLNINGTDNLLPNGLPTQFNLNDGDIIILKTLHRGGDCSVAFTNIINVSCAIDYGFVYVVNFGDQNCDFCPQWDLIPIALPLTTIYSTANYPQFPNPSIPGNSYANTTNQAIDLFFNPTIIHNSSTGLERLYLLENGVIVHTLFDGTTLFPIIYTLGVGQIIGFKQDSGLCFKTETFINNETCDIFIGSQFMQNNLSCPK